MSRSPTTAPHGAFRTVYLMFERTHSVSNDRSSDNS
jgi:hypothetical protein